MIDLQQFYRVLRSQGVEFVTGVPDTLLNDFCLGLDGCWPGHQHVIAANEGNAIALAAGYHLATGSVPLVYMQNSGLGNAINPLISLADKEVYAIPMLLLIGWRGEPGASDWPQHRRQGELTPVFLDAMGIPYRVLAPEADAMDHAKWALTTAAANCRPTALVVRKGVLALREKAGFDAHGQRYAISREEAIGTILSAAPDNAIFVATTGRATRELHALRDARGESHDRDFLNVGAMGHALSIAAGLALAKNDRAVICLDGDGAALMHMGSLAVTAALGLPNLLHVVLNNGVHESVGGQQTAGFATNLCELAAAVGYRVMSGPIETTDALRKAVRDAFAAKGPSFIEMRIRKGMRTDLPPLRIDPVNSKKRLMNNLSGAK
ncbi:MAG: Benzoylformate decarboxylase [Verrucomicrobia bacterium ADurb.Bin006]|nr:MAG: Benzoylformate decarboxylase [Verrucomicrobia bacterium ADurb.Bin006]